jgi:hypothetical protein
MGAFWQIGTRICWVDLAAGALSAAAVPRPDLAHGAVIAGLTRNPVVVWHWIPDRVRDDKTNRRVTFAEPSNASPLATKKHDWDDAANDGT